MDWAFFAVNGLHFCGIFKEKKIIVRISGKKKGKSSEISVKFENLEKMSKWTRLFQSSLTNKQTK